jgi:ketosteroid isomerase-like protein
MPTVEERLEHLEDELAIRSLTARFADTATRNDMEGFRALWTPDATWMIGTPNTASCNGIEEIMALFHGLWTGKDFFVHFAHSGVIEMDGSRATARWLVHEVAKGPNEVYYTTYGFFDDVLVKTEHGWHFSHRAYTYLYLDTSPFSGKAYRLP